MCPKDGLDGLVNVLPLGVLEGLTLAVVDAALGADDRHLGLDPDLPGHEVVTGDLLPDALP
ncbi:hypothetical protein D3C83_299700 [compost metagenome]